MRGRADRPGGADVLTIALDRDWIPAWGLRFVLGYDGIGLLMLILTARHLPLHHRSGL